MKFAKSIPLRVIRCASCIWTSDIKWMKINTVKSIHDTVKPLFNESLGDWFFLHFIKVFSKWGLCKITSETIFFFFAYSYSII
jgi:hypothetical protein